MRQYPFMLTLLALIVSASVMGYYTTWDLPAAQAEEKAKEEKVFDPVCGMEISKDSPSTFVTKHEGNVYHFCSKMCKANFERDPDKYACLCAKGGHPGCICGHCQETGAKCECKVGAEAEEHEKGEHHHHEGGEHHHH